MTTTTRRIIGGLGKRATINLKLPDSMARGIMDSNLRTSKVKLRFNEDLPLVDDDAKTVIANSRADA